MDAGERAANLMIAGSGRLGLVAQLYEFVYERTDSFESQGACREYVADALYLVGAVAKGGKCEWPRNRSLLLALFKEKPALFARLRPYLVLTAPECACGIRLRLKNVRYLSGKVETRGFCRNKGCSYSHVHGFVGQCAGIPK
jgi:hypothetical protein